MLHPPSSNLSGSGLYNSNNSIMLSIPPSADLLHSFFPPAITSLHFSTQSIPTILTSHAPSILLSLAVLCLLPLINRIITPTTQPSNHNRNLPNTLSPPSLPQLDPFLGLDTIVSSYAALSKHSLLSLISHRFTTTGHTYTARMLNKTMIATCEPDNLKAILATQFTHFDLGSRRKEAFSPLLGHSIFASDGPTWKAARAALRPSFAKEKIGHTSLIPTHADALVAAVKRTILSSPNHTVDLQPLFFRLSLDIATDFFFGTSCSSLRPSTRAGTDAEKFAHAFNTCQQTIVDDFVLGPIASYLPHWRFRRQRRIIHGFVDGYVRDAIAAASNPEGQGQGEREPCILEDLARCSSKPEELRDQALSLLVAGRDTTASLLSNLWHVLSQRPDIWNALQEEVATLKSDAPAVSDLKELRYLQACLKESLRLHPPVPVNVRQSTIPTTLPTGGGPDHTSPIPVPAGTIVSYSVHAMHRRPDLWGPDAGEFKPERWMGERRVGWDFLPFNGGARICLGQQLALAEAGYATVRLLQAFEQIRPIGKRGWRESLSLTCCVDGGVEVGFVERRKRR